LEKSYDYLIIACDGIWDCLTSQECVTLVREYFNTSSSYRNMSDCLESIFDKIIATDVASSGGIGCDNMTAIVIQLKN